MLRLFVLSEQSVKIWVLSLLFTKPQIKAKIWIILKSMDSIKAFKIKLFGRVQGVSMRLALQRFACTLGLVGQARNLADGSVEVVIQGAEGPVTNFINFCKQGNEMARIENVEVVTVEPGEYNSFEII